MQGSERLFFAMLGKTRSNSEVRVSREVWWLQLTRAGSQNPKLALETANLSSGTSFLIFSFFKYNKWIFFKFLAILNYPCSEQLSLMPQMQNFRLLLNASWGCKTSSSQSHLRVQQQIQNITYPKGA